MKSRHCLGVLLLVALSACVHPISGNLRRQVDPTLSFAQILSDPQKHIGKKVVLGGVIVETRNLADHSDVEVVQKNLDAFGYPGSGDESQGRFLFRYPGYLESEIYSKGRLVTGGGTLTGTQKGKIGEVDYEFPVIAVEELKLWEPLAASYYGYPPYAYGPYWGRYWGAYPFYPYGYYGPFFPHYYY